MTAIYFVQTMPWRILGWRWNRAADALRKGYRGKHRGNTLPTPVDPWNQADPWQGTSPNAAAAEADHDLTPTGMLRKESVRLDNGDVVGTPETPPYKEIADDVEHGFDKHWNDALAESRARLDAFVSAAQTWTSPNPEAWKSMDAAWSEVPTGVYAFVPVRELEGAAA